MAKPRRTVLSGIVTPVRPEPPDEIAPVEPKTVSASLAPRRGATKSTTIQQTLYLAPAVHDQLREIAFTEKVKMHTLVIEGLDAVFRARGMRSVADLTK